jgi:uncharacterized protein
VLLRLAHLTNRADLREAADRALRALASKITAQPVAVPQILVALDYALGPRREIVIAGDLAANLTRDFLVHVRARFLPRTFTLLVDGSREKLTRFFPAAANMEPIAGQPTAYVCQDYVCQLPTIELSKFDELLQ